MTGERTYTTPAQVVDDLRTAYDHLHVLEDINSKEREAGNPNTELEAKAVEMRARIERRAKAYSIDLDQ